MRLIQRIKLTIFVILIVVFSAVNGFPADKWTTKNTVLQGMFLVADAVDYLQTREISKNPKYYEMNPILGRHPSQSKIAVFFFSAAVANTAIAYYLPSKLRTIWQLVSVGFEVTMVGHNIRLGVKIHF